MRRQEENIITQVPRVGPSRSRRDEEGIVIAGDFGLRSITQGLITGGITSLTVPQVKAGAYIDITIAYNAYNPNGSFWNPWKIFLVAKDSLGNKELVKDATIYSNKFSDSGTWRLWKMPSQNISLVIRLFGHDEVKSWDWAWWS